MTGHTLAPLLALLLGAQPAPATGPATQPARRLVTHLVFEASHIAGQKVKDLAEGAEATITGPIRFRPDVPGGALLIEHDESRITLPYDAASDRLPKDAITTEVWVALDHTTEWGGIIGVVPGNGGSDGAWLLGFRQSSFSFGLSTKAEKDKEPRRTHLRAPHSLEWGRWYHVVGTYDGSVRNVYVNGRLAVSDEEHTGGIHYPKKAAYRLGAFEDQNSTARQRAWVHEIRVYDYALDADEVLAHYRAKAPGFPELLRVKIAPTLERLTRDTIRVTWETAKPTPSVLALGRTLPLTEHVVDKAATTRHAVTVSEIDPEGMYYYRIRTAAPPAQGPSSRLFEYDATFDYSPIEVPDSPSPYADDGLTAKYAAAARQILQDPGITKGYCLVLGSGEGRLAYELARQSLLHVVCVEEDPAKVATARDALDKAGLYGVQVTVHQGSLTSLAYQDYCANLVVSDQLLTSGKLPGNAAEVFRVLRPVGGVAYLGRPAGLSDEHNPIARAQLEKWIKAGSIRDYAIREESGLWAVIRRGPLPNSGAWTHQYGDAGNSSNSGDGVLADPMEVLWFGRPGPRPMVDRGTRNPAPLSLNGRLFVQGDRRLFGIDAYNGTILWELEIPDLRRANVPRDCSNMAAIEDSLYVVVRDRCWHLDASTGKRRTTFTLPVPAEEYSYDWGYLACVGDILLGSAVKPGALFIGADGEWYDRSDEESDKVTSAYIFALDRKTGKELWSYRDGAIIDATLAVGGGQVYLIEGRSLDARAAEAGRLRKELTTDQYLVGLDLRTGKKRWEHYYHFSEGRWVFYLSYANDTLVALSTSDKYHLYAFNAEDGTPLWQTEYGYHRTHHGGGMQHPAIVGDVVFAEPRAFKLRTGEVVHKKLPGRGGCGAISASANCLFFRDGYHTMWHLESNRRQKFTGLRPGCWLGIIPAGGILLAPESSAGCFCDQPIQTSIAFLPRGSANSTRDKK